MGEVVIWHNPRCGTSRRTLALLRERGIEPLVVEYLKTPPSAAEIRAALRLMGKPARALVRQKEPAWREAGLDETAGDDRVIQAMVKAPIVIERPVVFANGKAALGRPPEAVLEIL